MKNFSHIMNRQITSRIIVAFALLFFYTNSALAQEEGEATETEPAKEKKDTRPLKDVFESGYLINSQTVKLPTAKTLEFIIQHRFGLLNSEEFDFAGMYAPSNIRMGFNYTFTDKLQVGIGSTKNNKLQDLNWKYALLRQTRSGNIPLSVTYFGNAAIDVRKDLYPELTNRLSYFHQVIIGRKFSKTISFQVAPSISHFNMVNEEVIHTNFGISAGGRVMVGDALAITFEYDQLLTAQNSDVITVKPNISLGIEASTGSHVFQVFLTTGQAIINQHQMLYNQNDFTKMDFAIGFNMTRLWNY